MYEIVQQCGVVEKILQKNEDITTALILYENNQLRKAINYNRINGDLYVNERVLVNTTAVDLELGTGGFDYIYARLAKDSTSLSSEKGHIMKLRYTPLQLRTKCVEAQDSPHHEIFKRVQDIGGLPVIILPLHSLLAPVVIVFKHYFPEKRIIYIMTEGGSLSLEVSFLVRKLKKENLLDKTITVGQSFGGDLETVNIFTGLLAACHLARGDLIIVGMGPGITGTGTKYGYSGTENAFTAQAVHILKGRSIVIPRISLADSRKRHYGISHHTCTLLKNLINHPIDVVCPEVELLINSFKETGIINKHNIFFYKYYGINRILNNSGFNFNSMGRNLQDDPLFFITAGLAVKHYREITRE
ncbi:MAG: DUF3866 family protein [Halanaerobiales bacterium]